MIAIHTHLQRAWRSLLLVALLVANLAVVAQAQTKSEVGQDYKISPSDQLDIKVLGDPEGSAELRVSKSGAIKHPYMGDIQVAGLTESQAARKLATALRDGYLVNPKVTVAVISYSKMRFTILGAVNGPDTYEVPANKRVTIIEAIGLAKGFKDTAKSSKVMLSRLVGGRPQQWEINVKGMMANPKKYQPVYIQDGDVINVPESFF